MILYVNGDSHSAGAEAAVPYNSIGEDLAYNQVRSKAAHPKNIEVCYGQHLANSLNANLVVDAISGGSNKRIIRTTREFVEAHLTEDVFVVIGWAVVDRDEIYHNGEYHCLSAGSYVPQELEKYFKEWILNHNQSEREKAITSHEQIIGLHRYLLDKNVNHLFFNTVSMGWDRIPNVKRIDWNGYYLNPYNADFSYFSVLRGLGCEHAIWPNRQGNGDHFGSDAHLRWAEFLLPHIKEKRHLSAVCS